MDDDDDDDGLTSAGSQLRQQVGLPLSSVAGQGASKQGLYCLPSKGIFYFWKRVGTGYTGITIRDVGGKTDICDADFSYSVVAASSTSGRRTNTNLPVEDLPLLKEECCNSNLVMEIKRGIVLESCVPSPCTVKDLEQVLGMSFPWDSDSLSKHKVEMVSKRKVPVSAASHHDSNSSKPASLDVVAVGNGDGGLRQGLEGQSVGAVATHLQSQLQSNIDVALNAIRTVLVQLGQDDAMNHLTSLTTWLKVVKGTRSKARGGKEYIPSYMLDAVLLSDRLKTLDDMGDAMKEFLAKELPY